MSVQRRTDRKRQIGAGWVERCEGLWGETRSDGRGVGRAGGDLDGGPGEPVGLVGACLAFGDTGGDRLLTGTLLPPTGGGLGCSGAGTARGLVEAATVTGPAVDGLRLSGSRRSDRMASPELERANALWRGMLPTKENPTIDDMRAAWDNFAAQFAVPNDVRTESVDAGGYRRCG